MNSALTDINSYVDRIFYINMDKDVDRNKHILGQFKKHGIWNYERISGVLIDSIPENHKMLGPFEETQDKEKYIRGSIGCLYSHQKILKIAVERNYTRICIIEDDITLVDEFPKSFSRFINDVERKNSKYQFAYLGLNNYLKNESKGDAAKKLDNQGHAYGSYAYIINNQDWVFKYILTNIDFVFQEIDLLYNAMIMAEAIEGYVSIPNLVLHKYDYGSNISKIEK